MRAFIMAGAIAAIGLAVALLTPWASLYLVWDRSEGPSIPRVIKSVEVRATDLPAIVEAMSRSSADMKYATLAFGTPDRPGDGDTLNIEISAEKGKIGFNWVLLGPRNIEDQERFEAFARASGAEPHRRSMNGVSYLRVEHGDPARFAASVVTEMYGLPENEPLGLFHEGFVWP